MMNNTSHETVFKSLQELKEKSPIIAIFTPAYKVHSLQIMVNALGFKAIFPSLNHKNLNMLKDIVQGVVIDTLCFEDDIEMHSKDLFSKKTLPENVLVNICDISVLSDCLKTNSFKSIVKRNISLYVLGDKVQKDRIYMMIKKYMQSFLSFRTPPMPAFLHPQLSHDIFYNQNQGSLKIMGSDNPTHVSNCSSLFYTTLSSALMAITENVTIAAMSASIIIRAASRRALSVTNGPGSFMPVFLDSLFHLKREYLYQIQLQDKYMNIKEQLVT